MRHIIHILIILTIGVSTTVWAQQWKISANITKTGLKTDSHFPEHIRFDIRDRTIFSDNLDKISNNDPYSDQHRPLHLEGYPDMVQGWWEDVVSPKLSLTFEDKSKAEGDIRRIHNS